MLNKVDKASVLSVYSGTPGCCCGCKGKHRYRKDPELRALAGKSRGYPIDDDEVNEAQVTRVVNVINANLDSAVHEVEHGHVFLDMGSRWYIAYLRDAA